MSARLLLATSCVMACVTGCTQDVGFGVALTITVDHSVDDTTLQQITHLVYSASGDEDGTYASPLTPPIPRTEDVVYRPAATTRALQISISAQDSDGTELADGATTELSLSPGHTTFAEIILRGVTPMDLAVPIDGADFSAEPHPDGAPEDGADGAVIPPIVDPCRADLPLTADQVFASNKHIVALYDFRFPLSIDFLSPTSDYYEKDYLSPMGEGGKWLDEGGLLRTRPLGQPPVGDELQVNSEHEIRAAIGAGIRAFAVLVEGSDSTTIAKVSGMMAAAAAVDSRFKIIPLVDTVNFPTAASIVSAIQMIAADKNAATSLYYVNTTQLLVMGLGADKGGGFAEWQSAVTSLGASGVSVTIVPILASSANMSTFAPISFGFGPMPAANPNAATALEAAIASEHTSFPGKAFFSPVQPQAYTPSQYTYDEAQNSTALRDAWTSAILGGAEWVFVDSWNSFISSSQIEPSTDATLDPSLGSALYDLSGFYGAWYLTGVRPTLTHDVLYWFHRREATSAAATMEGQGMTIATGSTPSNSIELVALLTDTATLTITIGNTTSTSSVMTGPGVNVYSIPLVTGTPTFTLSRAGKTVVTGTSGTPIVSSLSSGYLDLTYLGGSASSYGKCTIMLP